jgi:hypothetical protein
MEMQDLVTHNQHTDDAPIAGEPFGHTERTSS